MNWLQPQWPAPPHVVALCTTRQGGVSLPPFDDFNLAQHVGDEPARVAANRERLQSALPGIGAISWLNQVHGTTVVAADAAHVPDADAQHTDAQGLACSVLTADCLPVLFCDRAGTQVAAAHAGWRGLCDGVLEATVAAFRAAPGELLAWLGPAIGPERFEVGDEVREAFLTGANADQRRRTELCFRPSGRAGHWVADIYALARLRLGAAGVEHYFGGGLCTVTDSDRFYSYRRDGVTGRMASLIYIIPDGAERW